MSETIEMYGVNLADLRSAIAWGQARASDPASIGELQRHESSLVATAKLEGRLPLGAAGLSLWMAWYESTKDTPCIAICSTSQGDDVCRGCGRTFGEVTNWLALTPFEKRHVWSRITQEGSALRFNEYRERAGE